CSVNSSPPTITLQWPDYDATDYTIYRKSKDAHIWGASVALLPGDVNTFTDTDVVIDSLYEYRVKRNAVSGIIAEGYLLAGIQMQAVDYRGKCLLIVDTTDKTILAPEIYRLMQDLSGDGWVPFKIEVSATNTVEEIREIINSVYLTDNTIQSVFLFGHVPVPYSGNLYPDGHPDHQGAWPADGIYGDTDGEYSDTFVNNTIASRPENWNIPGDGKYDNNIFDSPLELQIGRVDLSDLPDFAESETTLLKNYLDKNHAFRNGDIEVHYRGLIDDNFGAFGGEAFAANGWRNFAPIFGDTEIYAIDYFTELSTANYLWSYGCGGGWYQGAGGIGSTTDFTTNYPLSVFTMLFGSYFGDWDNTDNFLRAALASGSILTNVWAGRPHLQFHQMALGETIGYCIRKSQNNTSTYITGYFPHYVHIALMGDPTLRMHAVKPVNDVLCNISALPNAVEITFSYAAEPVDGYYVYRSDSEFGMYSRITADMVNDNVFVDANPNAGLNYYMVKAVKLQTTPSGSYYNTSIGKVCGISVDLVAVESIANSTIHIFPNPVNDKLYITTGGMNALQNVCIYSIVGDFIMPLTLNQGENVFDISPLQAGVYILKFDGGFHKFIKQ
ncbi:MAG: T9SS type A sorting domain-containing protein, partial [Chitinophagales bacterium]